MKKKAVAVICSTKTLSDFVWYYVAYGAEYEWDVIVLPNGENLEDVKKIHQYLKKSEIFKKIVIDTDNSYFQPIYKKICLLLQMIYYFLIGKQNNFCKKYINKRIDIEKYSLVVIPFINMILLGAFLGLSDEYKTVILEDGFRDYKEKKDKFDICDGFHFWSLMGFFFAKMGYCNTSSSDYKLEKTKNCIKYSTLPDKMKDRNYKCIEKLNDMSIIDVDRYDKLMERIYGVSYRIPDADIVLITAPLIDYSYDMSVYILQTIAYIYKRYPHCSIVLKKHPRDSAEYIFPEDIKVTEIDRQIPFEYILNQLNVKYYFLMFPSSVLFYLGDKIKNCKIFYYQGLCKRKEKRDYQEAFDEGLAVCEIKSGDMEIIEI